MKKIIGILVLVFAGIVGSVGSVLYLSPHQDSNDNSADLSEPPPTRDESPNVRQDEAAHKHNVWEPVAESRVPDALKRTLLAGTAFVQHGDLTAYGPGDSLVMPVPQEATSYTALIEKRSTSASGNVSLMGTFELAGEKIYKFTLTQGASRAFATFNTPAGGYQMDASDGIGRIVPVASMRAQIDYTKSDYRIPVAANIPEPE